MAQSTYNTILKAKNSSGFMEELIAIKEFPDLGGEPETLETTTMRDRAETYIFGNQSMDTLTFTVNYDVASFGKLSTYADNAQHDFELWFGENGDGSDGIFTWSGQLEVWALGKGVNEVRETQIAISPSTVIALQQKVLTGGKITLAETTLTAAATLYGNATIDDPSYTYQWYSSTTADGTYAAITDSTAVTLTGASLVTSKYYKVSITATSATGFIGGTVYSDVYYYVAA